MSLDFFAGLQGMERVLLSILFILVAAAVSRWQKASLEADLLVATVRSFVQLIAVGYALELIFAGDNPLFTLLLLALMTVIAARVTAQRGTHTPNAQLIALASIGIGSALTIASLVALGVFPFDPQHIIPIGGMIIGNAMTTAALVMNRLGDDFRDQRGAVESLLALGATSQQASLLQFRRALRGAMIPVVDTTRTVGLIKLPGAMTGMILAGASPLEAVKIQMIVMYMLVGAATFTGLIAAYLTTRQYFNTAHQLRVTG